MSPEAYEVLAASSFPTERRRYFEEMADQVDTLRSFLALEGEADRAQKRAEGEHWAGVIGSATETDTGTTTARLWELLVYSHDRDHRERAAALICRRLRRRPRVEAA